jgi:hypothetical protein
MVWVPVRATEGQTTTWLWCEPSTTRSFILYRHPIVLGTDLSKTLYFKLQSIPAHLAEKYCNKENKKVYRFLKKAKVAAFLWYKNKNGRKLWNNSIVFPFALYSFLLYFPPPLFQRASLHFI